VEEEEEEEEIYEQSHVTVVAQEYHVLEPQ